MRRKVLFLILVVVVMVVVMSATALPSVAQDAGDTENPCLNGIWNCNDPINPDREQWNWACGWYYGHSAAGEFSQSQIPEWCTRPALRIGCYDSSLHYSDQSFEGQLNTPDNAHLYSSGDGTCSMGDSLIMWVRTDLTDPAEVIAYCNTLGGFYNDTLHLATAGFLVHDDIWACAAFN